LQKVASGHGTPFVVRMHGKLGVVTTFMQTPPMHVGVVTVSVRVPVVSHTSVKPPHKPAIMVTVPHVPAWFVQAVWLAAGAHSWQAFIGLSNPFV
jgi:hypothetical protein